MGFLSDIAGAAIGPGLQLIGANKQKQWAGSAADRDYHRAKEFARHSIKWKVADAKEAGINPLVALGAATHSFSPSMVGGEDAVGGALKSMGQDISRAAMRNMSSDARKVSELNRETLMLKNDPLRS